MATAPLVPSQIEPLFQVVTAFAIGALTSAQEPDPNQVRIEWQSMSQPVSDLPSDVVYLRCIEEDDEYDRVRDSSVGSATGGNAVQTFTYNRVWRTYWNFWGPNSFDRCRMLRSALLTNQNTHDSLAQAQLYLVTDTKSPVRFRDRWAGGLWIERCDFEAVFNERVVETPTVPVVITATVEIITDRGLEETVEAELGGYGVGGYDQNTYGN